MSTPNLSGPDAPQPFAPEPAKAPGGGCGKPVVIGCTVVLVLVALAFILLLSKAQDLFSWSMNRFEQQVTEALPADLSDAERRRLGEAFAAVRDAVVAGEADPQALLAMQGELQGLSGGQELDRESVLRLTRALEAAAGIEVEEPPDETPAIEEAPPPVAADSAPASPPL